MKLSTFDFSFFFPKIGRTLAGMSGSYVDDIIRGGTLEFYTDEHSHTRARFNMKETENDYFNFTGMHVKSYPGRRTLSQQDYIELRSTLYKYA
jgi:hypothetical protein